MGKIEKYQDLIANLLEQQVAPLRQMAQGEVQEQVIIDTIHHHFQWLTIGWDNEDEFRRKNEQYVMRHFTQLISSISKEAEQKLKQPQTIRAESGFPLKFDYSWQNGTLNLIKPLSFDVLDENTIIEKTEKFIGIINIFGKQAKQNNQRLDILITPPQDIKLQGIYENAYAELDRYYEESKKLITEKGIKGYAHDAVKHLIA